MATTTVEFKGMDELKQAIERNPELVRREAGKYLQRASSVILRETKNPPWRLGSSGGGSPKDTGALLQSHVTQISLNDLMARIYTNDQIAPYASYVHEGTSKLEARPWLDYAVEQQEKEIMELQDDLLDEIVKDMAS